MSQRLQSAIKHCLERQQQRLQRNAQALHTLSPLQTLGRGYAIVKDQQQRIIRNSVDVQPGDQVNAQLGQGQLQCTVDSVE